MLKRELEQLVKEKDKEIEDLKKALELACEYVNWVDVDGFEDYLECDDHMVGNKCKVGNKFIDTHREERCLSEYFKQQANGHKLFSEEYLEWLKILERISYVTSQKGAIDSPYRKAISCLEKVKEKFGNKLTPQTVVYDSKAFYDFIDQQIKGLVNELKEDVKDVED